MTSWGIDRNGDVLTVWSTDLRRNLRKIAESKLGPDETLVDHPRDHDRPGKPSRFRIVKKEA